MKNLRQSRWLVPLGALLAASLLLSLAIYLFFRTTAANSDMVANQIVFGSFKLGGWKAWMPPDNFILKLPIYWFVDHVLGSGLWQLVLTTILVNLIGLVSYFFAFVYFVDKLKLSRWSYLLFVWVFAMSMSFVGYLSNPSYRNMETGLVLLLFSFIGRYLDRQLKFETPWQKVLLGFIGVFYSVLLYSDPYYIFTCIIPIIIWLLVFQVYKKPLYRRKKCVYFLTAIVLMVPIIGRALFSLGFSIQPIPTVFTGFAELPTKLMLLIQSLVVIFNASFFGQQLARTNTILSLVNFGLLIIGFIVAARSVVRWKENFWLSLFGFQVFVLMAYFLLNSQVENISNARYLILLPYLFGIFIATFIDGQSSKLVKTTVVVLTCVSLAASPILAIKQSLAYHADPNIRAKEISKVLQAEGLQKGYSDFWNANIISYFSDQKLTVVSANCDNQKINTYYWLISSVEIHEPADKSFYIQDNDEPTSRGCDRQVITAQFGQPLKTINFDSHTTIYVFPKDILAKP